MSDIEKKRRSKMEHWLDKHNHTMELMRTEVAIVVLTLQIFILYRLF